MVTPVSTNIYCLDGYALSVKNLTFSAAQKKFLYAEDQPLFATFAQTAAVSTPLMPLLTYSALKVANTTLIDGDVVMLIATFGLNKYAKAFRLAYERNNQVYVLDDGPELGDPNEPWFKIISVPYNSGRGGQIDFCYAVVGSNESGSTATMASILLRANGNLSYSQDPVEQGFTCNPAPVLNAAVSIVGRRVNFYRDEFRLADQVLDERINSETADTEARLNTLDTEVAELRSDLDVMSQDINSLDLGSRFVSR